MRRNLFVLALLGPVSAGAALQSLDESALGEVSGQAGLSLEISANLSIDSVNYWDDGAGLSFRGVRIEATGDPSRGAAQDYQIGVTDAGGLYIPFNWRDNRLVVSDVSLSDHWDRSLGTFISDINAAGRLHVQGYYGAGLKYSLDMVLSNSRFTFRDQGNEFILDDISGWISAHDNLLVFATDPKDTSGQPFIYMSFPRLRASWDVGAVRYSNNPAVFGGIGNGGGASLPSYGGLHLDYDVSTIFRIHAGGRSGAGFTVDNNTVIYGANFRYLDNGNALALEGITGQFFLNNLTLDVASDPEGDLGLAIQFDRFKGNLDIAHLRAGDMSRSFGALQFAFDFRDGTWNGRNYTNRFYVQGQGDRNTGYQGIRIDAEWSLPDATARYIDDGNAVIFSGIQAWGRGDITFDVTRAGNVNGQEYFDGLRIGFENVKGGYKIDGLRVGRDDAPLQGGTELLLALEVFPAYDFTLNGHYTLGPGGAQGEGITVNADLHVTEGNAAIMVDENSQGVWLTGVDYDQHLRDMTIDVDAQGLMIVKGEAWSTLDISDLRIGSRQSDSIGRIVLKRYEKGSTMSVRAGGAGQVCVGGSGTSASSCAASGGRWEDRGQEGVTIALKQIFSPAVNSDKRTQLIWETNRRKSGSKSLNGTGTQLIIDDISTNDGVDGSNTYGFRNDINVDVYETRVVTKRNGVGGGAPGTVRTALGFAVRAQTSFKELSIGSVQLKHPDVSAPEKIIYGMRLQNFNITSNLTATPID